MAWYNNAPYQDETQVLIGSLLGDASLTIQPVSHNIYFEETHSVKQKDYLLWKNEFLQKILLTSRRQFSTFDPRNQKEYHKVRVYSKTSPFLKELYGYFYSEKTKYVNSEILEHLTPLGLAVWYCDDGCYQYHSKTIIFCTHAFSLDDHKRIQDCFYRKWNIEATIRKKKQYHYFYINRINALKFLHLIRDFVHSSMKYKLGEIDNSNKSKIEETREKIRVSKAKYLEKNRERINQYHLEYSYRSDVRLRIIERRKKNREISRAYHRKYYHENLEKIKAHRDKHKSQSKAWYHKYYLEHRDELLAKKKEYYLLHRKGILEKKKIYHQKHRQKRIEYSRNYHQANKQKWVAYEHRRQEKKRLEKNVMV